MDINWSKQLVDQAAHYLAGAIIVCIWMKVFDLASIESLSYNITFIVSFTLMMGAAYLREVLQHRFDRDPSLGVGSYVDLVFFALGGLSVFWIG